MVKINGNIIDPEEFTFKTVRRKSLNVKAVKMPYAFEVETLEGIMKGNAGDYLVRGVSAEYYPIKKELFERTYHDAEDEQAPAESPRPSLEHHREGETLLVRIDNIDRQLEQDVLATLKAALERVEQQPN